jgi:hypothetical protein
MRRILLMVFVAMGSAAMAEDLPVPPPPPAHPPPGEIAPVPNLSAHGPATPVSDQPSLDVKLYRAPNYDPSVGFAPGSRYQSAQERKPIQTPGFSISVPLQ